MKEKGVIIIITFLTLGILLTLGAYFLSTSLAGSRISKSQETATRTYYLAEAGVNEAIWKLKNDEITTDGDDPWETCFTTNTVSCTDCKTWSDTFVRNYSADSTTTVSIENLGMCARGEIIATSSITFSSGKTSQRVIKIKVLKSLGSLTENSPIFAGAPSGECTIIASKLNIYDGNIFSSNNINIKNWSTVNIYDNPGTGEQEGKALAVSNVNISLSTLNASGTCDKAICDPVCDLLEECPPDPISMPAIDFDSDEETSYKSRADQAEQYGQCDVEGKNSGGSTVLTSSECLFTKNEFENLLWQIGEGGTLYLRHKADFNATSTYYVEGEIALKGKRYLDIDGVLVADGTINIGEKYHWGGSFGFTQITITDPGVGIPSGLLTKGKMNIGSYSSFQDVSIVGLLYSQDEMRITSIPNSFNLTGGAIARKFSLTSALQPLNIYLDNDVIREAVWGGPSPPGVPYSPVVTIEHWEEAY